MKTYDFFFDLPKELIAQSPIEPRDRSRMLVYNRAEDTVLHKHFYNITEFLRKGDLLVLNNTRVLPARLFGIKRGGSAKIEILLLKRLGLRTWEVLLKPGKRIKDGDSIVFSDGVLNARVIKTLPDGNRHIEFDYDGVFEDIINRIGQMPLPHYITKRLEDNERYQTVYNKVSGSSAAPTAGLHFTPELLEEIKESGVEVKELTLDVGLGTFRPVTSEDIDGHIMHSEHYLIGKDCADAVNRAKAEGRRIIAVGTTSVRVLESAVDTDGRLVPREGDTSIFIYPGYKFKIVDGIITNFHLPSSTLIMLVSAFIGRENTLRIYDLAVSEKYRFFSFGDSTLLL